MSARYVRFFSEIGLDDVPQVGGKNASLGEMYRELTPMGVRTANGFALTAEAYRATLDAGAVWPRLRALMDGVDPADVADLARRAAEARSLVAECPLPDPVIEDTRAALRTLADQYGPQATFAVRSSATAEDLPTASFAGQHESYLNVAGEEGVLSAIRRCFASLFTDRAIRYRIDHGFDHLKVFNSVGVMKMVRSDLACSGVIFTLDTESGFPDVVFVTAAYGLGETVVQGTVDPDEYLVFKPTFRAGRRAVLRHVRGGKAIRLVYGQGPEAATRTEPTPEPDRARLCLSDPEILTLAAQALAIEDHYSRRAGAWRPMDIEWAKDGVDGELYVIQARPETVASRRKRQILTTYVLDHAPPAIATGHAVGASVAVGKARVIGRPEDLASFENGEILVAETTSPDWGTVMKRAAGIVTDKGGRTCHAAIVAREAGVPAIVGTERGSQAIRTGDLVTVSCAEGDIGRVYPGAASFRIEQVDLSALPRPRTKIMLNVGDPEQAFRLAALPNDGVGLARMEFIITEFIKAHPMALAHPDRVADPAERDRIAALAAGSGSPADFFVEKLSEGVGLIAAAFHPRPVIVRLSDFKTNEYAKLVGGGSFEPAEANPMIGFRGASRYAHPAYADAFALECAAIKRVRDDMGLANVRVMIPFCRRIEEADAVLAAMARNGLERGRGGLEVYVMCEIPNNVVLIDDFAQRFDGFSIGSNDLTQLVLGVDRDSEIVAFDFDERDPGVKMMLRQAIEGAHRNGRPCGICGQAPSDYPDMAEYLVRLGIDSLSLNPDSVLVTTRRILELEKKLYAETP
ncbi:phosphoenolpyruvate synthase [Alsobacter soli]|uniref:Phosphoenolpyruvate synthase n=1 Tax=Alsobacter soli TaxID=2109933 RepID=A0A2T1HWM6_9HYPH|nr:phosphoenolpyruvate synthase [Alsobacter soli]PSC06005.1 phosphoenolpyruvate synthase [Alsobacter soli]